MPQPCLHHFRQIALSHREQATRPDAEWHIDIHLHTQTSSQNKGWRRRNRNNSVTVPRTCVVTFTYGEKICNHILPSIAIVSFRR